MNEELRSGLTSWAYDGDLPEDYPLEILFPYTILDGVRIFPTGEAPVALAKEVERLREALEESVKLQSHYAQLLNAWDGGERMAFKDADAWIDRLKERGKFQRSSEGGNEEE